MPYSTAGKNLMLDALKGTTPATPITHMGLQTKGANKSVTATAAGVFTSTSHGYSAGDVVVFSAMTGGDLVAGHPYFVIAANLAANTFSIARTSGGTQVTMASLISAGTVNKLTEVTGGSPVYARKAIAFSTPAEGTMDDSTNGANVHDVPAGGVVDYVSFHSAVSAGTLLAIDDVTQETFAGQGTYTVTDADLDLLNGATA